MGMLRRLTLTTLITGLLSATAAMASEPVVSLWARATPPGATTGAIYGEVENRSDESWELETIEFTGARHAMVHETVHEDGMARMRHASLDLMPREKKTLQPGGAHIMLMGLTEPLVQGCEYLLVLHWSGGTATEHHFLTGSFGQSAAPVESSSECQSPR